MVVAATPVPSPSRPWRTLAVLAVAGFVSLAVPVFANHIQTVSTGSATYTVEFDHGGDNEWWVEVEARPSNGDSLTGMFAQVEGSATQHYMQFAANDYARQQAGWSKFEPDQSFQVPVGKRVMFHVGIVDGATSQSATIASCWFTHPAGVEQCGSTATTTTTASTTTTSSSTTTSGSTFNAPFTAFRGNEWWVQANVGTTAHCISKVDVRSNNGAWLPITKQSWGATAWGGSSHFPQGSILQMRATSCSGQVDLSSCRQWIPAASTDATIVTCPGGTPQPTAFDATFSGVKGNTWWVQASVAANEPLAGVDVRVNCAPSWRPLTKQSYGWSASFNIPSGSKVDFKARSLDGDSDVSGGYTWTAATPTTGCALGAWPTESSFATYSFSSGVCGGGECMHGSATLDLVYRNNQWTGLCKGEDVHSFPDGRRDVVQWTDRLDGVAPLFQTAKTVGAQLQQKDFEVHYGNPVCNYVVGPTLTVDRQDLYGTAMKDANGNYRSDQVWTALRDVEPENRYQTRYDTDLGMVFESSDAPRTSSQGSNYMVLTDTNAPLTMGTAVA